MKAWKEEMLRNLAGRVRTRHRAAPRSAHLLDRAFVARPMLVTLVLFPEM